MHGAYVKGAVPHFCSDFVIIIFYFNMKSVWKGLNWILLAQDRHKQWSLVNTEMSLRTPYDAGNFLTKWQFILLTRGLTSKELFSQIVRWLVR